MKIGNRSFDSGTYIMGILNVTPDSFVPSSRFALADKVLYAAKKMIEDGADVIDIGGESARPGYTQISDDEEIDRVVPAIERITLAFDIPVSVDTYKHKVAAAAAEAGAHMINDIWGLKYDDGETARIIAENSLSCCLTHNRKEAIYTSFLEDVSSDLAQSVRIAKEAGIADDKIIIDPGIGFAKSPAENLRIINCLERLQTLGYPLLLGTSRKSVIGYALDLPVEERLEGTLATTALAYMKGCRFVRVHDVLPNKRVISMLEAIRNS